MAVNFGKFAINKKKKMFSEPLQNIFFKYLFQG